MFPGRQFHFRLPPALAERFDAIQSEFPSLPTPTLLRLMLASVLHRALPEQVEAIQSEIRRKPEPRTKGGEQ